MAEKIELYDYGTKTGEDGQRRIAVEAALDLIKSAALGGGQHFNLLTEMDNLKGYADNIQEALKP